MLAVLLGIFAFVTMSLPVSTSAWATYATLAVNGVKRGAVVYLPSTYNANQHFPVLIVFHGANGSGAGMEDMTGFDSQADKHRFIVIYPDSVGPKWDSQGTTDLQFIQALLASLSAKLTLDPQRVYLSGYSDGGGFAQMLACTQAASFAGVATVGTNMGDIGESLCRPSQPLTYVTFHGTADPDVPYGGGPGNGPYATGQTTNSTAQVFRFWAGLDGCTSVLPSTTVADKLASGASVTDMVTTTAPCRNDVTANVYSISGGGHTWPGGTQTVSTTLGDVSKDVNASAIIMDTLGSHKSASSNACFEGASSSCRIAFGTGTQACVGGQLAACVVASCSRGYVQQGGICAKATASSGSRG